MHLHFSTTKELDYINTLCSRMNTHMYIKNNRLYFNNTNITRHNDVVLDEIVFIEIIDPRTNQNIPGFMIL